MDAHVAELMRPEKFAGDNFKRWQSKKTLDQSVMDAHVAELMRPEKFAGDNFKRWQSKVMDFEVANDTAIAIILSLLDDPLYDVYQGYTSATELWEALNLLSHTQLHNSRRGHGGDDVVHLRM
ncbi:hypothetical protein ACQ4PT_031389 [Festuca glaucescens]